MMLLDFHFDEENCYHAKCIIVHQRAHRRRKIFAGLVMNIAQGMCWVHKLVPPDIDLLALAVCKIYQLHVDLLTASLKQR